MRGRLLAIGVPLGVVVALGFPLPASAQDAAAAPSVQCQVTDPRLPEISGLVAVGDRLLAMNDGGDRLAVYLLDAACRVIDVQTAPVDPYDPEDMAVAGDGTVWLADTGDNNHTRATVALLAMRPKGSTGVYRLTYPDGPHDAEALLLAPDGTPYIVTKEALGASAVYRPASPMVDGAVVPMAKVATVSLAFTGTPGGPVGKISQLLVTGGAVSADGSRIALRTYTDAYVWPLSGSDVAGALAGPAMRVALPESPQGEAVSFTADDQHLVVASEKLPSDLTVVPIPPKPAVAAAAPAASGPGGSFADLTSSGRSPLTSGLIAAAVATVVVWVGGLLRRRKP